GSSSSNDSIQVVVTASRGVAQDPLSVPQSVTSISKEDLETGVTKDLDEAIRRVPGVSLAPAEGNPNYWQEGFSIRGLGAQRVLTLTDGVRQAGQGIGYGGGNLSLYDPLSVERIEILKGPASVLYGTDAFGGVLNIITRSPQRRTEAGANGGIRYEFDASYDANRVGGYFDFGDKDYGVILGSSWGDFGLPNIPGDEAPDNGSYKNLGLWGKAEFYIDNDTTFRILTNNNNNKDVLVADSIIPFPIATFPPPGASVLVPTPLHFSFPEYGRYMAGAELEMNNLSGTWDSLKTGFYWQQVYREFNRTSSFYPLGSPGFAGPPLFFDPAATLDSSTVKTDDTIDTIEWQTQARKTLGDHAIVVGVDIGMDIADQAEDETLMTVAMAGVGPVSGPSSTSSRKRVDANQLRVGTYVQDTWNLDPFEVIPGVRLDMYSVENDISGYDKSELGASGSLGTVYHVDEDRSAYLTLATGYRAPDLGERFQRGIVNLGVPSVILGKEDLDPERSWSAEAGWKQRCNNFQFEAATYVNEIKDYIGTEALGFVDGFATDVYNNLGSVTLYGGEVGGQYELTDSLSLYGNVNRTWTKDDTKIDVLNWAFNYGVTAVLPIYEGLFQELVTSLNFRSILESEDKTTTAGGGRATYNAGGFTVADLNLNLGLSESSVGDASLIFGIHNLFDRSYEEPFFPQLQPERSVYAGFQLDF
ncbi:MAG: TonB-dependent receptor, partial [Bdellovibrionales bacterium]|nr:TonB-dependent receptor [Bdellovibrionales bacterium]